MDIPPPESVVMSTKGQIVIPREMRQKVGLAAGSKVVIQLRSDGVLEVRPTKHSIDELFSFFSTPANAPTVSHLSKEEEENAILKLVSEEDDKTRGKRS